MTICCNGGCRVFCCNCGVKLTNLNSKYCYSCGKPILDSPPSQEPGGRMPPLTEDVIGIRDSIGSRLDFYKQRNSPNKEYVVGALRRKRLALTPEVVLFGSSSVKVVDVVSLGWWQIHEYVRTGFVETGPIETSSIWLKTSSEKLEINCKDAKVGKPESGSQLSSLTKHYLYSEVKEWVWSFIGLSLMCDKLRAISRGESKTIAGIEFTPDGIRRDSVFSLSSRTMDYSNIDIEAPIFITHGGQLRILLKGGEMWDLNPRGLDNGPLLSAMFNFLSFPPNLKSFVDGKFINLGPDELGLMPRCRPTY